MAITIQDLLASDTISQAVDKINFNFDQLLLNGGGPIGPAGPIGPPGPIGGRGERGTEWYEGTDDPNVTPPTLSPLKADYYLQSNGDVWEYTGLTWSLTGINLTGPQGPAGASVGWSQFGNNPYGTYAATFQNVLYPAPITVGVTAQNGAVAATVIGALGPNDTSTNPSAFKLNTTIAGDIDASVVSMLVHQKDTSAAAIKFMGGGAIPGDYFEQLNLANLSSIGLGVDDSIFVNVPKQITKPIGSVSDTYGLNIFTQYKAQEYRAGRSIDFITGNLGSTLSGTFDVSDFSIQINEVNSTKLPKFDVTVISSNAANFKMGGDITFPAATSNTGKISLEGGEFQLLTSSNITLKSQNSVYRLSNLLTSTGTPQALVAADSSGKLLPLSQSGAFGSGQLGWNGTNITASTGTDNAISRWDGTYGLQGSDWLISDGTGSALYPSGSGQTLGSMTQGVNSLYMTDGTSGNNYIFLDNNIGSLWIAPKPSGGAPVLTGRFYTNTWAGGGPNTELHLGLDPSSTDLPNDATTVLYLGNRTYQPVSGAAKLRPKMEIAVIDTVTTSAELEQSSYARNAPGIYAQPGNAVGTTSGISEIQTRQNILKIKGADGSLTSYSNGLHHGKPLHLVGGDGGTLTGVGGPVIIAAGGTTDVNTTSGQQVWIGYNTSYLADSSNTTEEQIIQKSTNVIGIGPTQGANTSWQTNAILFEGEGYVQIQQPPSGKYTATEEEYVLSVRNNRTTAGSTGGFRLTTLDKQHTISMYPNLSNAAYWSRTEIGDSGIVVENSGTSATGSGGFFIALKDRGNLGIKLAPEGGPSTSTREQILFYGNSTSSITDSDELAFRFRGKQTIEKTTTVLTTNIDDDMISSGQTTPTIANSTGSLSSSPGFMNWMRIGRIVHVTAIINFDSNPGQRQINLPIIGPGGADDITGLGTGYGYNLNAAIEVKNVSSSAISFSHDPPSGASAWWGNAMSGYSSWTGGNVRVQFSYRLKS